MQRFFDVARIFILSHECVTLNLYKLLVEAFPFISATTSCFCIFIVVILTLEFPYLFEHLD